MKLYLTCLILMVSRTINIILIIGFFSCNQGKTKAVSVNKNPVDYDLLETLYHRCDTVITTPDTVKIINTKFDTTIIETGVFTFLQYDYPLTIPHKLIDLSKAAIQFDKQGQGEKAETYFKNILDFYFNERPEQVKHFSDMNGYLQYEVNTAILCSFAYERLGDKDKALKILQPFLANVEAWNSRIHEWYIQLCISQYGVDKVRTELNSCGRTIKMKKQNAPEKDDWVVSIFGADIGVGKAWETDNFSTAKADSIIRGMDFYKLIQ